MTTLAAMKARIASDLRRTDLTTQIADAITTAIEACQTERFFFNETRDITFNTVADQEAYDGTDHASIPKIQAFDYVKVEIGSSNRDITWAQPSHLEYLNGGGQFTGEPQQFTFYQQKIRFYPIPADVYPIRIGAHVIVDAPAADDEADNPWMTHAERLIRARAMYEIFEFVLYDTERATIFNPDNMAGPTSRAMTDLRRRTNNMLSGGWVIEPMMT